MLNDLSLTALLAGITTINETRTQTLELSDQWIGLVETSREYENRENHLVAGYWPKYLTAFSVGLGSGRQHRICTRLLTPQHALLCWQLSREDLPNYDTGDSQVNRIVT